MPTPGFCGDGRFLANRSKIAEVYDDRFCRMWEYYLCGAEMGFRYGGPHELSASSSPSASMLCRSRAAISMMARGRLTAVGRRVA